jgi:hypothetical protein
MGARFMDDDSRGFLFGEEGEAEQEEGEGAHVYSYLFLVFIFVLRYKGMEPRFIG